MIVHLSVHLSNNRGAKADFKLGPVKLSSITDLIHTWHGMGWVNAKLDMALPDEKFIREQEEEPPKLYLMKRGKTVPV